MEEHLFPVPFFIIVGGLKCGTTSLHHWLARSPEISIPDGELHFFSRNASFELGYEYYRRLLGAKGRFSPDRKFGDDTASYADIPVVPRRIHEICPASKILWMLRDPLERSISNYWHSVRKGWESRSIDKAFSDELEGRTKFWWQCYIDRSLYSVRIRRFLEYFPKSQMHFIAFSRFIRSDQDELDAVCKFLDIDAIGESVPHSNAGTLYPFPWLNRFLRAGASDDRSLRARLSKKIRQNIRFSNKSVPLLNIDIRNQVCRRLEPELRAVRSLTGREYF